MPLVADFRQNPLSSFQADSILAAIPMLSSSLAGKLGKSPGDFTFSPPVKHVQLWPHQYVTKLDSSNMAYKDLTMPQFVFGYVECLRNSPVAQQAAMLS